MFPRFSLSGSETLKGLKWHPLTLRETIPPNEILDAVPDVDDLPQIVKRLSLSTGRRSTAPYQKSESDRAKGPYIWSDVRNSYFLRFSFIFHSKLWSD